MAAGDDDRDDEDRVAADEVRRGDDDAGEERQLGADAGERAGRTPG